MPRTARVIAVGLLSLTLASSTLQAFPSSSHPRMASRAESGDLLAITWKFLVSFLAPRPESSERDSAAPSKEGSQLDPNGLPGDGG